MARIKPLEPNEVDNEAKEIFEDFLRDRGNIPNMFRTLAYRPKLLKTAFDHFMAVLKTGTVDFKLKEMIAVRVSQMNECGYWLSSHTAIAKGAGVSDDTIEEMANKLKNPELFTEKELIALEFAEVMTTDSNNISDELYNDMKKYFDDGQIIEIACVIGTFNYFNKFNNALKTDITK